MANNSQDQQDDIYNEALQLRELLDKDLDSAFLTYAKDAKEEKAALKLNKARTENPHNMLFSLHSMLANLGIRFREMVMSECDYSTPTYYRHMRPTYKLDGNKKIIIVETLSNAEKVMIRRVFDETFKMFWDYYIAFLNTPNKQ